MDKHTGGAGVEMRNNNSVMNSGGGKQFSDNAGRDLTVHNHYYGSEAEKVSMKKAILSWLKPITVDYKLSHETAWDLHTDTTGDWFLDSPKFKEWRDGKVMYLACQGKPGAGKTVMSSVVVEDLKEHVQNDDKAILYVYIRDDQRSMHSIACVLCGILLQVVERKNNLTNRVIKLYEEWKDRSNKVPSVKSLQAILCNELSTFSLVFLVIDALDEWQPQDSSSNTPKKLMAILEALAPSGKVMATSRNAIPFSKANSSDYWRELDISANSHDLLAYLNVRREEGLFDAIVCSEEVKDELCQKIVEIAEGMFIVVQLVADNIMDLPNKASIDELLQHIDVTEGIKGIYKLTLERIKNSRNARLAFIFLSWILYTENISAAAIQHGVAMSLGSTGVDIENNLSSVSHLSVVSGGLITISSQYDWEKESEVKYFQFVHFTTKESLMQMLPEYLPGAQSAIAMACLQYLPTCLAHIETDTLTWNYGLDREQRVSEMLRSPPLFRYALLHWHLNACIEDSDHDELHTMALEIYQNPHVPQLQFRHECRIPMPYNPWSFPSIKSAQDIVVGGNMTPEAYLALSLVCHGPLCMLKALWKDEFAEIQDGHGRLNPNQLDEYGHTPLCHAARYNNVRAMNILLENEAVLDILDREGRTPLSHAAGYRCNEAVKLLLERGAVADRRDNDGHTPLSHAAEVGEVTTMTLLLEKGAQLDSIDERGRTPVSYAAGSRNDEAVKLLLERGAVADRPDNDGRTPLSHAATTETMSILLEKGANPDSVDKGGRSPLSHAAEWGHNEAVKLLLERGAVADRPDNQGRTPLSHAIRRGRVGTITILLEKGAQPDSVDEEGRTPLSHAASCKYNRYNAVKLLLERGAVADRPDNRGRTPRSYAAERGHASVVQLLHRAGACHSEEEQQPDYSSRVEAAASGTVLQPRARNTVQAFTLAQIRASARRMGWQCHF